MPNGDNNSGMGTFPPGALGRGSYEFVWFKKKKYIGYKFIYVIPTNIIQQHISVAAFENLEHIIMIWNNVWGHCQGSKVESYTAGKNTLRPQDKH